MNFIHAVVFDKDEFENGNYDTGDWGDLADGDYIVHCLYDVDNERIIVHEDNCHASVEAMISSFLDGVRYVYDQVDVKKAFVVVDNGCSYISTAVKEKFIAGNYGEVM